MVGIQLVRIGGPLTGYHGFNEAFYFTNGLREATRDLFSVVMKPVDANNPFGYPLMLSMVLRIAGESVAAARALSIVSSFATVLLTFWVARQLFNRQIALMAAVMLALTPGMLLTGRNIQIDPLMLALELGALGCYLRSVPEEDTRWAIASGVLFGFALATKLSVLLVIAALVMWQVWRTKGFGWLRARSTWVTALSAGLLVLPWYAARLVTSPQFQEAQRYLAGTGGWRGIKWVLTVVSLEQVWMFSPVLWVLGVAGLVIALWKRTDADLFVACMLLVQLFVYLFYNFHSYYFLPLLPFGAIAASRALWAAGVKSARAVVLAAASVTILVLPVSVLALDAKKWGAPRLDKLPSILAANGFVPGKTTFGVWSDVEGELGPATGYYLGRSGYARPIVFEDEERVAAVSVPEGNRFAFLGGMLADPTSGPPVVASISREFDAIVLFGHAISDHSSRLHVYAPAKPTATRVGPLWQFGILRDEQPDPEHVVYEMPR